MPHQFKARLVRPEGVGTWTFLVVPERTIKKFPKTRSRIPIKGTIDNFPIMNSLLPRGDGRYFMVVKKAVRDSINKSGGDLVDVTIELDTTPRRVSVPADLKLYLQKSKAKVSFENLSYSRQKEFVDWIEEAKRPKTRKARIVRATERIHSGKL